jgi:hypothetical protein
MTVSAISNFHPLSLVDLCARKLSKKYCDLWELRHEASVGTLSPFEKKDRVTSHTKHRREQRKQANKLMTVEFVDQKLHQFQLLLSTLPVTTYLLFNISGVWKQDENVFTPSHPEQPIYKSKFEHYTEILAQNPLAACYLRPFSSDQYVVESFIWDRVDDYTSYIRHISILPSTVDKCTLAIEHFIQLVTNPMKNSDNRYQSPLAGLLDNQPEFVSLEKGNIQYLRGNHPFPCTIKLSFPIAKINAVFNWIQVSCAIPMEELSLLVKLQLHKISMQRS